MLQKLNYLVVILRIVVISKKLRRAESQVAFANRVVSKDVHPTAVQQT